MQFRRNLLRELICGRGHTRQGGTRRPRKVVLSCENLEGRVTPAHGGLAHHALAHLHAAHHAHHSTSPIVDATNTTSDATSTTSSTTSAATVSSDTSTSSSSSTLSSALQTLRNDVQTIELSSDTTAGELTSTMVGFQTLSSDGLTPSSESALKSFENSLVTDYASGTTLIGNATLLSQFEALYTSSPTSQETTDLTAAYNALAAAVTSSNITSADITTINTDWAAVLAAEGSTSTATYPYFNLVTGQTQGGPGGGGGLGGGGC
jgi:hypothetical protein